MTVRPEPAAPAISEEGLVQGVRFVASPNHDERPRGTAIELIVVHAISLPPGEFGGSAIEELFLNRLAPNEHPYYRSLAGVRVSAHFLVRRDGDVVQFVRCADRAWHAGESRWRSRGRCNDYSIGIELEGADEVPFEPMQYERLAQLTNALCSVYPIVDIKGHADVSPGRKTDPGPHFDWPRYRAVLSRSPR